MGWNPGLGLANLLCPISAPKEKTLKHNFNNYFEVFMANYNKCNKYYKNKIMHIYNYECTIINQHFELSTAQKFSQLV